MLLALCWLAGFESGEVRFPTSSGSFDADVYANRDYAVVVRSAQSMRPVPVRGRGATDVWTVDMNAPEQARAEVAVGLLVS